jgi:hypothetical protein
VTDDALEARRDRLVGDREIRRILLEDRGHGLARRVRMEGPLPREHLVEDRAESEDVRARVGGPALDLLGRHVAESSHDDARLRPGGRGRQTRLRPRFSFRLSELGEAEVEDLHAAVLRDEEVLGLEVSVDDPLLVRRRETLRDLQGVVDRLALREAATRELRAEVLSLQQLGNDVG